MSRAFFLVAVVAVAGCGHQIGDSCGNNVDCSTLGDRFCDTSPPGGYCTVEGCDTGTCPSEAQCVRFFVADLDKPCTYVGINQQGSCAVDEKCVCDFATISVTDHENCVDDKAHCAPVSSERRWCVKTCGGDGDCRSSDYECRITGTHASEPIPTLTDPGTPVKFCAPRGGQEPFDGGPTAAVDMGPADMP
jgi:hypothetical protein